MARFPRECIRYCITLLLLTLGGNDQAFSSYSPVFQQEEQKKGNGDTKVGIRTTRRRSRNMSLKDIRAALKRNPKDALLYYRAGLLEEREGDLGQALLDYQTAIRLKARVADSYFRMGVVWEKMGEFYDLKRLQGRVISGEQRRNAIDSYKSAIKIRRDHGDALYRLSLVYLMGNDLSDATDAYNKLLEIEPDSERIKQLLQMIYKRHRENSKSGRR